jgi:hypothetical protein
LLCLASTSFVLSPPALVFSDPHLLGCTISSQVLALRFLGFVLLAAVIFRILVYSSYFVVPHSPSLSPTRSPSASRSSFRSINPCHSPMVPISHVVVS